MSQKRGRGKYKISTRKKGSEYFFLADTATLLFRSSQLFARARAEESVENRKSFLAAAAAGRKNGFHLKEDSVVVL